MGTERSDNNKVVICTVQGGTTAEALGKIKKLDKAIGIRAVTGGMEFSYPHGISENHRQAWENVIRGIVYLF